MSDQYLKIKQSNYLDHPMKRVWSCLPASNNFRQFFSRFKPVAVHYFFWYSILNIRSVCQITYIFKPYFCSIKTCHYLVLECSTLICGLLNYLEIILSSKVSTWPSTNNLSRSLMYCKSCTAIPSSSDITAAVAADWPKIINTGSIRMDPKAI